MDHTHYLNLNAEVISLEYFTISTWFGVIIIMLFIAYKQANS